MSVVPEILAANERYAAAFTNGDLPLPPRRRFAVLTGMDARIDPAKILGLEEGDAHLSRNAGGRASHDALRSAIVSEQLLGTSEIIVIHHTDCGMLTSTDEDLRRRVREPFGLDASEWAFMPLGDVEQSVRDDVARIRTCPFIPVDIPIAGFLHDVRTKRLHQVV
ncbi:MAG: carbonic anhydrase [Thermomicrobium sp.]|nr:carbonic anhydrase [Thermomicrobium sp.]